ncbi:MAG: ribosome biogenesis GTPase YlqF [Polyangiales bacterium]
MPIQWYPGHMTKARRVIAEVMPSQDVVIEVLDARMPAASANPVVAELRGDKPCVKVLSKSDLADPTVTEAWLAHFEADPSVLAIATSLSRPGDARSRIPALCERLWRRDRGDSRALRAVIVGIPNVGKSSLINTLMGRSVAAVSDKPAVTKALQLVTLPNGMQLSDNPGLLWPKIQDDDATLRLALGGAIPDTAIEYQTVGLFAAAYLLARYPALVVARYKLKETPASADALLEQIGRRRGCLRSGGVVDLYKAADILVHEFRAGTLGRVSLEAPPTS